MLKKHKVGKNIKSIISDMVYSDRLVEYQQQSQYHSEKAKEFQLDFMNMFHEWEKTFIINMPQPPKPYYSNHPCNYFLMHTPNILYMTERGDQWIIEYHPDTQEFSGSHSELNLCKYPLTNDPFTKNQYGGYRYPIKWHPIIKKWIELNPFIKQ